ncbi:FAD-dependent thymidylate synthase [Candidatus Uabimicrobium amorphum]|uniref:Flavin-dependent thymidylate synthase n=1 Tax=Uabimicrobium amorphum TaxID=2596890 RepID=A0A5S9F4L2_UABAM|nr:FAD-dependent thymidylate synthase [Candidatus Uabimicrobium amorphum]BBM84342.1 flavin-dependent thymidylate synthase [Candidatus Uabimicrobium amorphum]
MEPKQTIRVLDNDQGYITLLDHMGSEVDIVNAARVSYDKYTDTMRERDHKLLRYLIKNQHTSPLEMVVFKFEVYCPLFVTRQWFRHRMWSYNEVSRRYTSENIDFYIPQNFRKQDKKNKQVGSEQLDAQTQENLGREIEVATKQALQLYDNLLEKGVCREQARMVLPQNLMTKFIGRTDLNNLIKFLKLRDDSHSQWEIRVYAQAIKELIGTIVPTVIKECFHGDNAEN